MSLPGLSAAGCGVVVSVALAQTAGLLAGGGEASGFSVLFEEGKRSATCFFFPREGRVDGL